MRTGQGFVLEESITGLSLGPVCMTHPSLCSWHSSTFNPILPSLVGSQISSSDRLDATGTVSPTCALYVLTLSTRRGPISVQPVCLVSGSSLRAWHYLNLSVSSLCRRPSAPQTHRLGSDFQITLGQREQRLPSRRNKSVFISSIDLHIYTSELGFVLLFCFSSIIWAINGTNEAELPVWNSDGSEPATRRRNEGRGTRWCDMKTLNDGCASVNRGPVFCSSLWEVFGAVTYRNTMNVHGLIKDVFCEN